MGVTKNMEKSFFEVQRPAFWAGVSSKDWQSWRWQLQNRVRDPEFIKKLIGVFEEESAFFSSDKIKFPVAITPYYLSLITPFDSRCPIRMQSIPSFNEFIFKDFEQEDPLCEERDMPTLGLTHRYPDRVLLYANSDCATFCRHCMRRRKVSDVNRPVTAAQMEDWYSYIESKREIRDVIISGGEPLCLSDGKIEEILIRLRAIRHVEIIRIGTRTPVTLPQRITDELISILKKYQPVYIHTHFNHPKECSMDALIACAKLSDSGFVINNQMVLLKGVNDNVDVVRELNHKLLIMRVHPYDINQCDMVRGTSHFRAAVEVGLGIIKGLRGHTSGMAVPHFVVDVPGGGGKVPLLPEYVVRSDKGTLVFRNYKDEEYEYCES